MNLIFEKADSQNINVKIDDNGHISDFNYIALVKGLIKHGSLGDPVLNGDFNEPETASINSMVKHLNDCIPLKDGKVNLDGNSDEIETDADASDLLGEL